MNGGRAVAEELNQIDDSEAIVSDLKRQCTSTEYTYVYIIEVSSYTYMTFPIFSSGFFVESFAEKYPSM